MPEPPPLEVLFSDYAARQIDEMKARAEASPDSAHAAIWDAIRRVLRDFLPQPRLAFDKSHVLGGDLKGICRVKMGERGRIFYAASRAKGLLIVLYFGYRKAGDKNDAYAEFTRMLRRGFFDLCLREIGQERGKPKKKQWRRRR